VPFVKGQSANPRGRPKANMASRIKAKYGKDGKELLEMLDGIVRSAKTPPREKFAAVKELLDRGWGRTAAVSETSEQTSEPIFSLPSMPSVEPFKPTKMN